MYSFQIYVNPIKEEHPSVINFIFSEVDLSMKKSHHTLDEKIRIPVLDLTSFHTLKEQFTLALNLINS